MKENTINVYACPYGHKLVTKDVSKGTSPSTITCRTCVDEGKLHVIGWSQMYQVDQSLEPTHEWYAPQFLQRIADPATRQHCQAGGLLLREVGEGDYTVDLPEVPAGMNRPMRFSELATRALTNANR